MIVTVRSWSSVSAGNSNNRGKATNRSNSIHQRSSFSSGDDRKRANIAFCLSKLNIKTVASYRILKENFPSMAEGQEQNDDDYDKEEHLAWKKYLMVRLLLRIDSRDGSISSLACSQ